MILIELSMVRLYFQQSKNEADKDVDRSSNKLRENTR